MARCRTCNTINNRAYQNYLRMRLPRLGILTRWVIFNVSFLTVNVEDMSK